VKDELDKIITLAADGTPITARWVLDDAIVKVRTVERERVAREIESRLRTANQMFDIADFVRGLGDTEPQPTDERCPYCGHHKGSSTCQLSHP